MTDSAETVTVDTVEAEIEFDADQFEVDRDGSLRVFKSDETVAIFARSSWNFAHQSGARKE